MEQDEKSQKFTPIKKYKSCIIKHTENSQEEFSIMIMVQIWQSTLGKFYSNLFALNNSNSWQMSKVQRTYMSFVLYFE